jgi:hypothetical protein
LAISSPNFTPGDLTLIASSMLLSRLSCDGLIFISAIEGGADYCQSRTAKRRDGQLVENKAMVNEKRRPKNGQRNIN